MSDNKLVSVNDVVQLSPTECRNEFFRGCFMVVTEVKPWGVQGYVQGVESKGQAYYRAKWEEFELTGGKAVWVVGDQEDGS